MSTAVSKKPDIEAIMLRIREEVKASLTEGHLPVIPQHHPKQAQLFSATTSANAASPLLYSDELSYLNANWHNWNGQWEITSHRRFLGPIIVRLKKLFVNFFWDSIFKNYFEQEREFQMHLVRHLNATARYVDARDADIFWQLVNKIDHDIIGVSEQATRLFDQNVTTLGSINLELSQRIENEERRINSLLAMKGEIAQLDDLLRGLERTMALLGEEEKGDGHPLARHKLGMGTSPTGLKGDRPPFLPLDYLLFENRFRGSEEVIKERLRDYLAFFKNALGIIVELGCGRGEFLELLEEEGIRAVGIDTDQAMIRRCQQKQLSVLLADGLSYLEQQEDNSLGGLFAAQLIEHLSREDLERLIGLAAKKVKPGGRVLFETINPQSFVALACNFFRDPTHIWPLHPDTLRFMFEMKGLKTESILMRSPYPAEATLHPVQISEHLPARWFRMLESLNDNVSRLNHFLFGFQDYCIVGIAKG